MTALNTRAARSGDQPAKASPATEWWRAPFRTFQTNLREIDADLDVPDVLDFLEDFGANVWLLSVGGIVSNYPTALASQTANPALAGRTSGDLVGDAVAAAAERGIRVLGRMDFSKVDRRRAEAHPEWLFVNARGENQVYSGLVSVCPSGPYYQEQVFEVITEVLTRYDIAGFFLNWMSFNEVDYSRTYWGVCHCLACREGFAAFAPGTPLPQEPSSPGYRTWQDYARLTLDDLTARLRAHIRSLAPGAALILGDRADIVFHEANNGVGRPLWHHLTAEHVSAAKAYRPHVPVLVNAVGFVDMPYRLAGEEPNHFAQFLIQAIAHGAVPSTYVMGRPSDSPYENITVAGEITRFHRDHADVYAGLRPDSDVLLVRGDRVGPDRAEGVRSEFEGLYLTLAESHLPFDVLSSSRIADLADLGRPGDGVGSLTGYRVVVLADVGELAPEAVAALDAFVAAGGSVLATGSSALAAGAGQLAASPVRRHLAALTSVEATRAAYVRLDGTTPSGHPWGRPAPVIGALHVIEPHPDASVALPTLGRAPYGPPEKCYGHTEADHPGYAERTLHGGTVAHLPWTVGRVYREQGLRAVRDEVATRIRALGARPSGTGIPEQLQVVRGRSDAGTVVHLLNRSGDAVQRFLDPVPIAPVEVSLPWSGPPPRARALVAGVEVPVSPTEGGIRVTTPTVGRFEVLVLE
ncbi:alpha-amylase family protein [Occultella kanbiaonis]|uniref:alpha-amylase family protein n=1 Tax=Occultella kanbiaonis TaxID=2675754 RepID=UPI0013D425E3|nr:alpha-amylase family protein [Occultella kanbiaonis]